MKTAITVKSVTHLVETGCADLLVEGILKLQAERDALLAATQWRPIETAPNDGTVIVAHDWHRGCGIYGHDETELVSFKDGKWFGKDSYEIHYPTHWMPLPKPPIA